MESQATMIYFREEKKFQLGEGFYPATLVHAIAENELSYTATIYGFDGNIIFEGTRSQIHDLYDNDELDQNVIDILTECDLFDNL